jgi:hypothetical protein
MRYPARTFKTNRLPLTCCDLHERRVRAMHKMQVETVVAMKPSCRNPHDTDHLSIRPSTRRRVSEARAFGVLTSEPVGTRGHFLLNDPTRGFDGDGRGPYH